MNDRTHTKEQLIEEQQEWFQLLADSTFEGLAIHDNGQFLDINNRFSEIFGYSRSEIIKRSIFELVTPESSDIIRKNIHNDYAGVYEVQAVRKEGTIITLEVQGKIISNNGGEIMITAVRDICERVESEKIIKTQCNLGIVLNETKNLESTLSLSLEAALEVSGLDCGGIYLLNGYENGMHLVHHAGLPDSFLESASEFKEGSPNINLVRKGDPVYTRHTDLSIPIDENRIDEGLKAIGILPFCSGNQVIGSLNVASHTMEEVPKFSRRALESISAQIGNAIARARMEDTLLEGEQRFKDISYSIGDWIWEVDENGIYTYCSEKVEDILGYTPSEMIGKKPYDFMSEKERERTFKVFSDCVAHNKPVKDLENWNITKNGKKVCLLTNGTPIIEDGLLKGYRGVDKDITEKKRVTEQVLLFKQFAESSNQGFGIGTLDGKLHYANPALIKLVEEKSLKDLSAKSFLQYYPDGIRDRIEKEIIPTILNKGLWSGELELITSKGNKIITYESYSLIRDEEGNPLYLTDAITDITERKIAESELLQYRKHLEELVDERTKKLKDANDKLKMEIEERKKAEQRIKHEINFSSLLIDSLPGIFYMLDDKGNFIRWNENFESISGFSRDEILSMNALEFFGEQATERVRKAIEEVFVQGRSTLEADFITKDGNKMPYYFTGLKLDTASCSYLMGIGINIIDRKMAEAALRESEVTIRALLNASTDLAMLLETNGIIVELNQAACKTFGKKQEELIGNCVFDLLPPDVSETRKAKGREIAKSCKPLRFEDERNGRWLDNNLYPILDKSKNVTRLAMFSRDITERKITEAEISQKTEDLQLLNQLNEAVNRGDSLKDILHMTADLTKLIFPGFGAAIYLMDENQEYLCLENSKQLSGAIKRIEQFAGWKFSGIKIPVDSDHPYINIVREKKHRYFDNREAIKQVFKSFGTVMGFTGKLAGKLSDLALSQISKILKLNAILTVPLIVENECIGVLDMGSKDRFTDSDINRIKSLAGQLTAIIKRKKGEETLKSVNRELRDNKQFIETILDTSPDVIYIYDLAEKKNVFVNEGIRKILGYPDDEIEALGSNMISELMYPEDFKKYLELTVPKYSHLKDQELLRHSYRMKHKDGRWRWLDCKELIFERVSDGSPKQIFGVVQDVTIKRQADEKLQKTLQDLERSNSDLEQFAYVASHDLQEPLRKVKNFTELLEIKYKGQLDTKADKYISYITSGASRMQILITDLLSYSRVTTRGKASKPVRFNKIVEDTIDTLQLAINECSALITHDPMPVVNIDEIQMTQLLQNLVSNALKFRKESEIPKIHIKAEEHKHDWVFSVIDNGIGMDMEYSDRIFTVFQRLHNQEKYPGTGIGLAICKKIVERHEGRIWVESVSGKGSNFSFTIPKEKEK